VGASAPGEHGFNQRIREEKQRHYAQIAQRLFEVTRDLPVQGIVLAGMGADVGAVEPHLHPYVRESVLGTVRLNPKSASPADVLAAVLDVRREQERAWEQRHVQELDEGLGGGWAVNGIAPTLEALGRGQVRTLLVDPAGERPGFRCASGRLAILEDACGGGGGAVPVPDVVDEAIEDALRQGAHVDVVEDEGARRRVDGLAALLRFKLG
jgi:peptide chain release factor subunit 1